jgi:hypothetical protein
MKQIKGEHFVGLSDNEKIFYCHIHEVMEFFKSPPKNDFVLITHNSDGCITINPKRTNNGSSNDCDFSKILIPKNLKKWFSQNVDVANDLIESIPIGLENSTWFTHINKSEKIKKKSVEEKKFKNLLFVCHNIDTNPRHRLTPYSLFSEKSWATVISGKNGYNFDEYLNNLHSHKFVLCPEGNGIDTHRTWETLYVGSIPIEKRNLNNQFYQDLPICFVDEWDEIDEEFLNNEYKRINNTNWNLDKLDFNFWEKKIKNIIC